MIAIETEREAREPAELRGVARDHVRMLVSDVSEGTHVHARFDALPGVLRAGDLLVANDSATLPAALIGRTADDRSVRLHVADRISERLWLVEPRDVHLPAGQNLRLPGGAVATLLAALDEGAPRLWYAKVLAPLAYADYLLAHGRAIRYTYVERDFGIEAYQTMFSRIPGSSEMPSAARPFTRRTLDAVLRARIDVATVTLHAGVSSPEAHERPQPERFEVPVQTARAVNAARAAGRRVIAIGTTVVRALESAVAEGIVVASRGRTERIVSPSDPPRVVDGLLTGFHEPQASHLQMLATFLPERALTSAYAAARDLGYLWHEFGDVHLIVSAR